MVCRERSHQCKDVYLRLLTPNQRLLPSDQHSLHACTYMWLRKGRHIVHYSASCCFDLHTTFIALIQIQKLDITKCLGVMLNEKSSIVTSMKTHQNQVNITKMPTMGFLSFKKYFLIFKNLPVFVCYLVLQTLMYYFIQWKKI